MRAGDVGLIVVTVIAVGLLVAVIVLAVRRCPPSQALLSARQPTQRREATTPTPPGHARIAVVGCGLAAASFIHALGTPAKAQVVVYEAENRVGGRALSTTQPLVPVSTQTPMREFAAWIFIPGKHSYTTRMLDQLGVSTIPVVLLTPQSFRWSPETGKQSFGTLPSCPADATLAQCSPTADTDALWFAHTGVLPSLVPDAVSSYVQDLDLPPSALTPSGFGWQDVVLRGVGRRPVLYDRIVNEVRVVQQEGRSSMVQLMFASGDVTTADHVVLTVPPHRLLQIRGLPAAAQALIRRSFTTLSVGILYLAWTGESSWWGSQLGCVATTLPIGRVFFLSATDMRCSTCGSDNVAFWNSLMVTQGAAQVAEEVARQLSQVFGGAVPPPANAGFRGWLDAVSLLTTRDAATLHALTRPWGPAVPIWWASSDLSTSPGWVEGAVSIGVATAAVMQIQ